MCKLYADRLFKCGGRVTQPQSKRPVQLPWNCPRVIRSTMLIVKLLTSSMMTVLSRSPFTAFRSSVPGDDNKRDPDMDYIGCLGSNGQHSLILPFRVTFIAVTRYMFALGFLQSPSSDLQRGNPRPTVTSLREQECCTLRQTLYNQFGCK